MADFNDKRDRRIAWLVGATMFVVYAWFHPGGGWNQNSRFAQVRAIVEAGRNDINDFLYYEAVQAGGSAKLWRRPAPRTDSVATQPPYPCSGDVSFHEGKIYPNKPPGATWLAVPAYAVIHWVQKAGGADPDDWWAIESAAWLTTAGSVGVFGAVGVALFYVLSRRWFPDTPARAHVLAAFAFGLGTLMLPFSTMLFDHVPVAALLLLAVVLMDGRRSGGWRYLAAGLAAGFAALCNYSAVLVLPLIGVYGVAKGLIRGIANPERRLPNPKSQIPIPESQISNPDSVISVLGHGLCFVVGCTPPLALLAWYHQACFGGALTTAYAFQNPQFHDPNPASKWLGVFGLPDPAVAAWLLVSPHWGLLATSPLLVMSCVELWRMGWRREHRLRIALIAGIFLAFFAMNVSFNGWHGGYSIGPRYLIPAIPFLALPLARAFDRSPWLTGGLAAASLATMLTATAVHPLVQDAGVPQVEFWPPLLAGRSLNMPDGVFQGPIGASPRGVYDWGFPPLFPPGSAPARWNAFNVGEFALPGSIASVAPILLLVLISLGVSLRCARTNRDQSAVLGQARGAA